MPIKPVHQRLRHPEPTHTTEPARFALFNIALSGGEVELTDDRMAATHQLRGLELQVPFLSNLDSRRDVVTKPRLAFVLNGSAFDSSAATTPFAQTRETDVQFNIPALDLAPYLPSWPAQWPVRPQAGVLQLALKLAFEQREVPQVAVPGAVSLAGLRLQQVLPGAAGLDVLAFERLGVKIARLEPLAQRVDLRRSSGRHPACRWRAMRRASSIWRASPPVLPHPVRRCLMRPPPPVRRHRPGR